MKLDSELYSKYKDRTTYSLMKLKTQLTEQAKANKWVIPKSVKVINVILKERGIDK